MTSSNDHLMMGLLIGYLLGSLICCTVSGLECYTGTGSTVCGSITAETSTGRPLLYTTAHSEIAPNASSAQNQTKETTTSNSSSTSTSPSHVTLGISPYLSAKAIQYCITWTEESTKLMFKKNTTYGCDEEHLCDEHSSSLSETHIVKKGEISYSIKCCNTSMCNRPAQNKTDTDVKVTSLSCYNPSVDGNIEKCQSGISSCVYDRNMRSTPSLQQSVTQVSNESWGCDALKLCDNKQGHSQQCFMDNKSLYNGNITLCICCCQGNLCNSEDPKKQSSQCKTIQPTVPDHKPDGSTRQTLVVGLVSGGVMLVIGMVLGAIIYKKCRKGGERSQSFLQYRRVNADCVDDMEDVRMLLT